MICTAHPPPIVRVIKSRKMRWAGHVGKPDRTRPLRSYRSRWVDNIKMDFQKVGCGVWTGLR
jgi:hypothetical protein